MNIDFVALRQRMVDNQIRTVDVTRLSVLSAFLNIPREAFIPQDVRELAYMDENIIVAPPGNGRPARYAMAPAPLARLIQLAEINRDDFVLDIGVNTGYCGAVISRLAGSVIALESDPVLVQSATETLAATGCDNVAVVTGALEEGYEEQAPYDVILIEGSVDSVPDALFEQLREDGRLVVVEGHGNAGKACLYLRKDHVISRRCGFNLAVRPLPGFLKKAEFTF